MILTQILTYSFFRLSPKVIGMALLTATSDSLSDE